MLVHDKEYEEIKLLGHGKGGYSYLVRRDGVYYVLKQIHHEPCPYYSFGDKIESELRDYETLHDLIRVPALLEVDKKKERLLKEYVDGDTLFDYVLNDKPVEDYIAQIKAMTKVLYAAKLNVDYFPTNFIVNKENGLIYYIDYECNHYMEEWNFENWGIKYYSKTKEFMDYVNSTKTKDSK